jgi:hypothetical protein
MVQSQSDSIYYKKKHCGNVFNPQQYKPDAKTIDSKLPKPIPRLIKSCKKLKAITMWATVFGFYRRRFGRLAIWDRDSSCWVATPIWAMMAVWRCLIGVSIPFTTAL